MREIAFYKRAQRDLEEIFDFYFPKSPEVAAKIHDSILDEIERLAQWSEIGSYEKLLESRKFKYRFRSLVTDDGLFKIVYFVQPDKVVIAAIWSCRKNPKKYKLM